MVQAYAAAGAPAIFNWNDSHEFRGLWLSCHGPNSTFPHGNLANFRFGACGGVLARAPGHEQQHECRKPDDARTVAVVRIRQRAAHERRWRGSRAPRRSPSWPRSAIALAPGAQRDHAEEQRHRGPARPAHAARLIAVNSSSPFCCRAAFIAGEHVRRERLDHAVGVPDLGVDAVAGGDLHELPAVSRSRRS